MVRLPAHLLCGAGPRLAGRHVLFGTWSQDGNRRPSLAQEQLAPESDNCLEDSACTLVCIFACSCARAPTLMMMLVTMMTLGF